MNTIPSGIEADVCLDIAARQQKGLIKYGVTVTENPLPLKAWLQHAYEETLDQAIYLKRAIAEMDKATKIMDHTQYPNTSKAKERERVRYEAFWNAYRANIRFKSAGFAYNEAKAAASDARCKASEAYDNLYEEIERGTPHAADKLSQLKALADTAYKAWQAAEQACKDAHHHFLKMDVENLKYRKEYDEQA